MQLSKSLAPFLPACYISYHIAHSHQTPVLSSPRRSLKHRASTRPTKVGLAQKVLELVKKCAIQDAFGFQKNTGMRKGRIGMMRYHFIIYLDVQRKQEINATRMSFLTDPSINNFSFYFFPFSFSFLIFFPSLSDEPQTSLLLNF